ncbi:hypothetical protein SAMN04488025_12035 [Planifilum fulgidum]|uniref:Uncharacterized protein n=1 Tax=Planifilum fulgidum TaxID=201973 RepID=A0A1I2PWD3_9BACL|nr:hypothetical protein SAMN04488025_12035 [Planifilum fulgidum]
MQRKRRAKERMKPPVRKRENEKALRAVQSPPGVSFLIGRGRNFGCALLFFMGVEMDGGEALPPDLRATRKRGGRRKGRAFRAARL